MSLCFFGRGYILRWGVKCFKTLRKEGGCWGAQKKGGGGLTDLVFFGREEEVRAMGWAKRGEINVSGWG